MYVARILATALSLVSLASANAATLQVSSGSASVNNGQGFRTVATGSSVNAGDKIMIPPGASGQIVYENGCASPAPAGGIVTVGTAEQCAANRGSQQPTQQTGQSQTGPGEPPPGDTPGGGGFSAASIAIGLGVAGGVGAAIFIATQGNDKKGSP